jgi:hypothetical protein
LLAPVLLTFHFKECYDRCLTCSNGYECNTCVENANFNDKRECECEDGFLFLPEAYNICVDKFACSDDVLF